MSDNKDLLDGIKAVGDKIDSQKSDSQKAIAEIKTVSETKYAEAEKLIK
jgi:hypothetical protein